MFEVFDQPNASVSCERREVTTVPTQALTMFNNQTFLTEAQHLALRVEKEAGADQTAQVKLLYRIAFSREASNKEVEQSLEFLKKRAVATAARNETGDLELSPLAELSHVVLNSNEFVYIN